jgi:hypothetical protein
VHRHPHREGVSREAGGCQGHVQLPCLRTVAEPYFYKILTTRQPQIFFPFTLPVHTL